MPKTTNRTQIFPKPLPNEDAPPPRRFDDTYDAIVPLSMNTRERLTELLAAMAEYRKPNEEEAEDPKVPSERLLGRIQQFRSWRDTVAHPLFAAFVIHLREEGHSARVVVRSVESAPKHESVEFKVRLHLGNPYRPSGYVRVSISEYTGWRLEVSPAPDESRGRYSQADTQGNEQMTKEQLEAAVISVLDRLQARRF